MYSILKTILALKLTFILMIFGIGGSYVLENSFHIPGIEIPYSGDYFRTEITETSRSQHAGYDQPRIEMKEDSNQQVLQAMSPTSRLRSLNDLKIEIEL